MKHWTLCTALAILTLAGCSAAGTTSTLPTASLERTTLSTGGQPSCGSFGPNLTNNPQADLGQIATAMFTSPGVPFPASFLDQGPWFLVDSYGTGPLIGCQPLTSALNYEQYSRSNYYDGYGRLYEQSTLRPDSGSGGSQTLPATLQYTYETANPYRVATAQQFCFGAVNTLLNHLSFQYTGSQLTQIALVADSGCPTPSATYTFTYGNLNVPNLPAKITIVSGGQTTTEQFTYSVLDTELQSVAYSGGSIADSYSGVLLSTMNLIGGGSTTPLTIAFNPMLQWTGATDSRYNWGLTMVYSSNKTTSVTQNTGCPGTCGPSNYSYSGMMAAARKVQSTTVSDCVIALRSQQVTAGREFVQNGFAYATGSGQLLGPSILPWSDTLRQGSSGKYYNDPTCT